MGAKVKNSSLNHIVIKIKHLHLPQMNTNKRK